MIWVCILCRKKQELLIKTGTWMQRSTDLADDPIMRRIEQDVAPTRVSSRTTTPVASAISPAPSSTISSIFSRALSLGGTPTGPPSFMPGDQSRTFGLLAPRGRGRLARQRSLESSDSLSPAGPGPGSGFFGPRPPISRRLSEGGEEAGSMAPTAHSPSLGTPTAQGYIVSGSGGPPMGMQRAPRPRFRPPYPPRGPMLPRGRSFGDVPPPSLYGSLSTSASFHNRPVTPQIATPVSWRHPGSNSGGGGGGSIPASSPAGSYAGSTKFPLSSLSSSGVFSMSQNFPTLESVSAPEDAGLSSGHESGGSRTRDSNLYPRVLVSDGESRDQCPPLANPPSAPPSIHGGSFESKLHLLDPRSAARRSSAGSVGTGPALTGPTTARRRMDSTFRNVSFLLGGHTLRNHKILPKVCYS